MDMKRISDIFYNNADKIIICKDKEINKVCFPVIAIHETGFYIFFDGNMTEDEVKKEALNNAYQLQLFFNTSRLNFYIYSIDESNAYYINPFTDEIITIPLDNIETHIIDLLKSGNYTIDENKMYYYKEKINQIGNIGEKIKTDEDGNSYIKKGNNWYLASAGDPDEMFKYTLFGGLFGLHKFKQRKKSAGIGYLLTGGMLCIGWIFDMLAFILGVAKDEEGLYYLPISDKKKKAIILMCCIPLSIVVMKLYMFLITVLCNGIASVLSPLLGSLGNLT